MSFIDALARLGLVVLMVPSSFVPTAAGQSSPTPSSVATQGVPLQGAWDVVRVAVDGPDRFHWRYQPDTPEYVGRALYIDGENVRFNGDRLACKQAAWRVRSLTWSELIKKSFGPRYAYGGVPRVPTPQDYELGVDPKASVKVYAVCRFAPEARVSVFKQSWIATMARDRIALRVDDNGLLILQRRAEHAKNRGVLSLLRRQEPNGACDLRRL